MNKKLFTSESVTSGHPDKICDQISDAILDEILSHDPQARVACEVCCTTGMVLVMGEISTTYKPDIPGIARQVIADIGYNNAGLGFDGGTCAVLCALDEQSADIAMGVSASLEQRSGEKDDSNQYGAGDQGLMFGYACDETEEYMPMPISFAHSLARHLEELRTSKVLPYLRPDGKTQVTVEYDEGKPVRIDTVVVSTQHNEDVSSDTLRRDIIKHLIDAVLPSELLDENTKYYVNPTGRFVTGGPQGDSGLTGRKIIVDTYGGYARHGGGSFSGKDPTKVDRSAAYAARWIAKNIVAAGLAKKCEIQVAYAIGVASPVSVYVNSYGTGIIDDTLLSKIVEEVFDLRPLAIIKRLDLRKPVYRQVAAYGHFGRNDLDLSWERTDEVAALKKAAKKYL